MQLSLLLHKEPAQRRRGGSLVRYLPVLQRSFSAVCAAGTIAGLPNR